MKPRLSEAQRTAIAAALFAMALGIAVLRAGSPTHLGGLRLGAPLAMNDFYSSVYYPVLAFVNGENPHDGERLKALYPQVEEYPPYLPLNLVLFLPFSLLGPGSAAVAFFAFNAILTLVLSALALRLAGSSPRLWRIVLVAALLLLSRPGHWALISGQHAIVLAVLSYVALLQARRSPVLSGLALGVCMYKLTYGVPLAVLMLASGYAPAVLVGITVAAAVNTPLLLLLAQRAGGVGPFVGKLFGGYHAWENSPGMDPGSSLDPMSFNRIDLATFVSRFVGSSVPTALSIVLTLAVLALASLGLWRLARHRGRAAQDLSLALVCLGVLISVYHMTYDIVLLTAPLVALVSHGLATPLPRAGKIAFGVLFAVPCLNWALTQSALQAWQPAHHVWLAVASVNPACLVGLFGGYLALALAQGAPVPGARPE
jgi:hypothetical protein